MKIFNPSSNISNPVAFNKNLQKNKPMPIKSETINNKFILEKNRGNPSVILPRRRLLDVDTPRLSTQESTPDRQFSLGYIQALPNVYDTIPTIKEVSRRLVKEINNSTLQIMISENYLQAINRNKDRFFSGSPQKLKNFETQFNTQMENLNNLKQDLQNSKGNLKSLLGNNYLAKLLNLGAETAIDGIKDDFRKSWSSAGGGLTDRIGNAKRTAKKTIDDLKSEYSKEFQLVARQNVVSNFPDLSKFSLNTEAFAAMPEPIKDAISSVKTWEYITNYSSAGEWFNSTDYWADNIQSVASWASHLAKEKKGLVFPDGTMIIGMADEASFRNLNLQTSNNRTDWNYAYGLLGLGADGIVDWLGISAQAGWNTNYIFNYNREANILTQQNSNSAVSAHSDFRLQR